MGNPTLHHSVVVDAGPTPPAAPPAGPYEVRCCALCSRCKELGFYGGSSGWAMCEWQGRWEFPERGCDRFDFDPSSLGEEEAGTAAADSGE